MPVKIGSRRLTKLFVVFFLATLLDSGTCRYLPRILFWAYSDINPAVNWYLASKLGDESATSSLYDYSYTNDDLHWIKLLADSGSAQAQFQLALNDNEPTQRSLRLKQAVAQEYPPALYEYGQITPNESIKLRSLNKAAEKGYKPAQRALYHWHWLQEEYELAKPWLEQLATSDPESALLLARYLWKQQDHAKSIEWFEHADQLGSDQASDYLDIISFHWRNASPNQSKERVPLSQCKMQLQFVATSIESAKQALHIQRQFF